MDRVLRATKATPSASAPLGNRIGNRRKLGIRQPRDGRRVRLGNDTTAQDAEPQGAEFAAHLNSNYLCFDSTAPTPFALGRG